MAGKGSKPRNCFSEKFKKNFEDIDWATKQGQEIKNYKVSVNGLVLTLAEAPTRSINLLPPITLGIEAKANAPAAKASLFTTDLLV